MMAAAVQKNGVQALANGSHHIDMNSVECVSSSVSETETQEKTTEEEPAPEIDIVINNVVCSFSVRCHLNLKEIATYGANVEYRKENGMVTMKLRKPYTTASIWSSGKITCTGATSEDNAKIAARRFARSLQKLGFKVRFNNFRVVNVLGTCSMPFGIKINAFSAKYPKEAEYEPEIHPGVTYRLKEPKATLKIFSTGSITVTAPCVSSIAAAIEHIYPLVYEFKKERTKEDEFELEQKKQKKNGVRKRRRLYSYEDQEEYMEELMEAQEYSDEDSDWVIDESLGEGGLLSGPKPRNAPKNQKEMGARGMNRMRFERVEAGEFEESVKSLTPEEVLYSADKISGTYKIYFLHFQLEKKLQHGKKKFHCR